MTLIERSQYPLILIRSFRIKRLGMATSGGDMSWYFSQVKGALYDEAQEGIDFDTLAQSDYFLFSFFFI